MDVAAVQQQSADTILERGVRFKIPAPFLLRLLGKKTVSLTIYRPRMGTLIYMSRISAGLTADLQRIADGSLNEAYTLIDTHGELVAQWLAVAILNKRWKIRLFTRMLTRRIVWGLSAARLSELFVLVAMLSGVKDFTNIIRYLNTMNILTPKTSDGNGNLSHNESGS